MPLFPIVPLVAVWYVTALATLFVFVSILMTLVILIQKPRGGGLSGAFGGAGGSAQAAFGAKTGDVLTWGTVTLFVLFLLLAIGLTKSIKGSMAPPAPVVPASQPSNPASTPAPANTPAQSTAPTAGTTSSKSEIQNPKSSIPPTSQPAEGGR